MSNNLKKESNVPAPTADNSRRLGKDGGGNTPVTGEKHGQAKATHVTASQNRSGSGVGPEQPTRQNGDGNMPVTGESHDQAKAEKIPESARW